MKTPIPYASPLCGPIDDCGPTLGRRLLAALAATAVELATAWLMMNANSCEVFLLGAITLAPFMLGGLAGGLVLGRYAQLDARLRWTFLGVASPLVALPLLLVAYPKWGSLLVIGVVGFNMVILAGYGSFFGSLITHRLLHRAAPPQMLRTARARRWLRKAGRRP